MNSNELIDSFMKIDSPMERSLIFEKHIMNATMAYQPEFKRFEKLENKKNCYIL